ncbi:hypothetical protein K469DRAFT_748242 [Zopfia rhizophila CBS 207.26]|uniref:Uncharacterized protein n=1 Tax=Zopfia rhizophila CBS 207.26 TaxID=1314779 RepID=A0A6A6EEK6_9PEZI|nr:hypothetical protein K469DRAFT_748242 [Zopfia rhizophila CBS 207.26]
MPASNMFPARSHYIAPSQSTPQTRSFEALRAILFSLMSTSTPDSPELNIFLDNVDFMTEGLARLRYDMTRLVNLLHSHERLGLVNRVLEHNRELEDPNQAWVNDQNTRQDLPNAHEVLVGEPGNEHSNPVTHIPLPPHFNLHPINPISTLTFPSGASVYHCPLGASSLNLIQTITRRADVGYNDPGNCTGDPKLLVSWAGNREEEWELKEIARVMKKKSDLEEERAGMGICATERRGDTYIVSGTNVRAHDLESTIVERSVEISFMRETIKSMGESRRSRLRSALADHISDYGLGAKDLGIWDRGGDWYLAEFSLEETDTGKPETEILRSTMTDSTFDKAEEENTGGANDGTNTAA